MSIRVIQSSQRRGTKDYWDWEMMLDGEPEELNDIEYVEYTLHETFKDPIRREYNIKDGFKLKTSGWGNFRVYIRLHYKDPKKTDEYCDVDLQLNQPEPISQDLGLNS